MATFGEIIKAARTAKGLSYRALGERMGLQHVVIYEMETGKRMPFRRPDRLQLLATELEVDLNILTVKSIEGRDLMPYLLLGGRPLVDALIEALPSVE